MAWCTWSAADEHVTEYQSNGTNHVVCAWCTRIHVYGSYIVILKFHSFIKLKHMVIMPDVAKQEVVLIILSVPVSRLWAGSETSSRPRAGGGGV